MNTNYWVVFTDNVDDRRSSVITAICRSEEEVAQELLKNKNATALVAISTMKQLYFYLKKQNNETVLESLSVQEDLEEIDETVVKAYETVLKELDEIGLNRKNAEKMIEDVRQGGYQALNSVGSMIGKFAAKLETIGKENESKSE